MLTTQGLSNLWRMLCMKLTELWFNGAVNHTVVMMSRFEWEAPHSAICPKFEVLHKNWNCGSGSSNSLLIYLWLILMYLVISLLVLRAGYGIWLYQFLIIAYLFTFHIQPGFSFTCPSSHQHTVPPLKTVYLPSTYNHAEVLHGPLPHSRIYFPLSSSLTLFMIKL